ncbi:MAG: cupredoxin domain-containing protein [Proteobacteria bacterium]|nr:cupredoxin domain-containing protein [Pseudomonadota bacterium]
MMFLRYALACALVLPACSREASKAEPASTSAEGRFEIKVTKNGFEPADVKVPAGKRVTLVFERKTDETCAKEVVLQLPDGTKIDKPLPLDTPVEIAATFPTSGVIGYACGMDMARGTLTVQ